MLIMSIGLGFIVWMEQDSMSSSACLRLETGPRGRRGEGRSGWRSVWIDSRASALDGL